MLNNIDKEIKYLTQKREIKVSQNAETFRKIAKLRCREICEPQNREINVSRKFHVISYIFNCILRIQLLFPFGSFDRYF